MTRILLINTNLFICGLAGTPVSEQSGETGGWEAVWQKNKLKILILEKKLINYRILCTIH